jgi:hypothetical protein
MPADNTLNFTTNVDLTGLNAGLDAGQGAVEEFSAATQASVRAVDAVWDVFVEKNSAGLTAFDEILAGAIAESNAYEEAMRQQIATSEAAAEATGSQAVAQAILGELTTKRTQAEINSNNALRSSYVTSFADQVRLNEETGFAVRSNIDYAASVQAVTAAYTELASTAPAAIVSAAPAAGVAATGTAAAGTEDIAATDAMAASQAAVAEQTAVATAAINTENTAFIADAESATADSTAVAATVAANEAATTAAAARVVALEAADAAQLRDQAAVNAYTAASARGTAAIKAMGAAYTQAVDAGLSEVEALEAAVAAVNQSTGANNLNTESLETNTAAMAVNRGEAMGTARVIASSMGGNVTGMEYGLARIAASSKAVSSILQTMMPVAIWAVGLYLLYDMGDAYYSMYTKAHQAGEELALEGNKNVDSIEAQTAAINVENDKLQQQIDKFNHVPNNGLKLTLDEAIESADKLLKSLNADTESLDRLLKTHSVSTFQGLMTGVEATTKLDKGMVADSQAKDTDEQKLRDAYKTTIEDIKTRAPAAKTKEEKAAIDAERIKANDTLYNALINRQQKYIEDTSTKNDKELELQRKNNEALHGPAAKVPTPVAIAAGMLAPGIGGLIGAARGKSDIDYSPGVATTSKELDAAKARLDEIKAEREQNNLQEQRNAEPPKGSGNPAAEKLRLIEQDFETKGLQESLVTGHGLTAGQAAAFWQPYLDAFKQYGEKGVSETNRVLANYVHALDENHAKFQTEIKKYNTMMGELAMMNPPSMKAYDDEQLRFAEDLTRTGERWHEYARYVAEATDIQDLNTISLDRAALSQSSALGMTTALGVAQSSASLDAKEYALKLAELKKELADLEKAAVGLAPGWTDIGAGMRVPNPMQPAGPGYEQNQTQQADLKNQIEKLEGQSLAQAVTDKGKVEQEIVAPFDKAFKTIESDFFKAQQSIINGTMSVSRAFGKMGVDIVQQMEESAEKMVLKWAEHEAMMLLIHLAVKGGMVATDAAAAATSNSIAASSGMKQIFIFAKEAAAGAFKSMAGIPLVGPELGAVAAGITFAAVMALGTLGGGYDQGGVIPGSGAVPILGHGGERVLTTGQTSTFDKMVTNMTTTASNSRSVHLNYNPRVSAYDSAGLGNTLHGHADVIVDIVQDALRTGKLSRP